MSDDKIIIKGLTLYGRHGCIKAESELGQKFIVDLELLHDQRAASQTDSLSKTVNYAAVAEEVKRIMEGERCNLLETLAERIARTLLSKFGIIEVLVSIKKPHVAFPSVLEYVGVEIRRKTTG